MREFGILRNCNTDMNREGNMLIFFRHYHILKNDGGGDRMVYIYCLK